MPKHPYDFAEKFAELLNEELRRFKLPGIVEAYNHEGKCALYYRFSGRRFLLYDTGSIEYSTELVPTYNILDVLDQIEEILENSVGLP
jgi:hypothetical protein